MWRGAALLRSPEMPTICVQAHVLPEPDVLQRVVTVCRRRYLDIVALNFGEDEIRLTVRGSADRCGRIVEWIGALVDVLDVAQVDSGG
jgi:acetolactate synthase small subunit